MQENEHKNDLRVVLIGFSVIILLSGLFFFKAHFDQQKKTISSSQDKAISSTENFSSVSATALAKKISGGEKLSILDLRDADSFSTEHILDAKNLTLNNLAAETSNLNKSGEYFFVDDLGLTPNEIQAMHFFENNGFSNISYLEGGLAQWKNNYEPTVSTGNPYSLADQAKVAYINNTDLQKEISTGKKLYIIDVRNANSYAAGHLAGAQNIPLDYLESRRHEIPMGLEIILYDDTGLGAFQGAVRLFDAGILNTYILSGGLNAWKQANLPITTQ